MNQDFTKGPWSWLRIGKSMAIIGGHEARTIVMDVGYIAIDGLRERVLRMGNDDGKLIEASPDHPDALLIAAAPDLFEAALAVIGDIDRVGEIDPTFQRSIGMLRAAVELAKGNSGGSART